jgi:hypothetical protein
MEGPTNSEVLWAKIRLAEQRLFASTHVFWTHPELAVLFPQFLLQAHWLMHNGLKFMASVRDLAASQSHDSVSLALTPYLREHLEEELGHDRWLRDDILTLGFEEKDILEAQPRDAIVGLLSAQYFWAMHVHPVAILGYLILMEGYPPLASQLEEVRLRTGAPATAFRCLIRHAEDDPEHLEGLHRVLDSLTLNVEQQRAVAMSAFAAIEGMASLFEELLEAHVSADGTRKELAYARA